MVGVEGKALCETVLLGHTTGAETMLRRMALHSKRDTFQFWVDDELMDEKHERRGLRRLQ
jgi:hypothetical protein